MMNDEWRFHGAAPSWAPLPPGRSRCPHDLLVRLPSFTARVASNSEQVLEHLTALYPLASPAVSETSGGSAFRLSVSERMESGGLRFEVAGPDGESHLFRSASNAVAHLDCLITSAALRKLRGRILIHAGVVAAADVGVLLPGASGVGKSTLVAALCLTGFRCLSDEIAVLDVRSGRVLSFPRAICLKDGGWRVLSNRYGIRSPRVEATRQDGEIVRYLPRPSSGPSETPVAIEYVLLPVRRPGARATLSRISGARAVAELALHSMNFPSHGKRGLEALSRLVEDAESYQFAYDDLDEAVRTITRLVAVRETQGG